MTRAVRPHPPPSCKRRGVPCVLQASEKQRLSLLLGRWLQGGHESLPSGCGLRGQRLVLSNVPLLGTLPTWRGVGFLCPAPVLSGVGPDASRPPPTRVHVSFPGEGTRVSLPGGRTLWSGTSSSTAVSLSGSSFFLSLPLGLVFSRKLPLGSGLSAQALPPLTCSVPSGGSEVRPLAADGRCCCSSCGHSGRCPVSKKQLLLRGPARHRACHCGSQCFLLRLCQALLCWPGACVLSGPHLRVGRWPVPSGCL